MFGGGVPLMSRHFVPVIVAVGLILFIGIVSDADTVIGNVVRSIVPSRTVATCTDTDGGNDYTARGTVTIVFQDGKTSWIKDRCVNPRTLYEYSCPEGNSPHYGRRMVTCPCRDGSCR
jgi:hypothetical protein